MSRPEEASDVPAEVLRREATLIALRLREAGFEAYFAGGSVRDRLLGKPPQDYDIATNARPEEIRRLFPHTLEVGARFGVVIVVRGGKNFEVATFRSDQAYVDGRRPEAWRFATAREDAERRDFTVNGMFEDPPTGQVIDFVGGRQDLERRTIRAIGDARARLGEDKLRLLRAVRFAAQLEFEIERTTLEAVRALAPEIRAVAPERVLAELTKTITAPPRGRRRGLELLAETGLLREVLPEVDALRGVPQPPEFHPEGDCWRHELLVMEHLPERPEPALAWGALLHDIGKPPTFRREERIRFDGHVVKGAEMAEAVLRRFRAPSGLRDLAVELVAGHLRFVDVPRMKESTLKRFLRNEAIDLHLALHRADCLGSHGHLDTYEFCRRMLAGFRADGEAARLRPAPLVRGHDLIAAGYVPGPAFRRMLAVVEDAQLEGRVATREEALALIRERFGAPPGPTT